MSLIRITDDATGDGTITVLIVDSYETAAGVDIGTLQSVIDEAADELLKLEPEPCERVESEPVSVAYRTPVSRASKPQLPFFTSGFV